MHLVNFCCMFSWNRYGYSFKFDASIKSASQSLNVGIIPILMSKLLSAAMQ